jgi:dynein intermediate chain 2, axonemal
VNVLRDPAEIRRPVSHLSWSPDGGTKIAATYCQRDFLGDRSSLSSDSYIWEISNPNTPLYTLSPPNVAAICTEYNPKDSNCLVSGLYNGQVAAWDTRTGCEPTMLSEREIGHRDTVNSVLWINSKTGTEFFSGGSDGQVIW